MTELVVRPVTAWRMTTRPVTAWQMTMRPVTAWRMTMRPVTAWQTAMRPEAVTAWQRVFLRRKSQSCRVHGTWAEGVDFSSTCLDNLVMTSFTFFLCFVFFIFISCFSYIFLSSSISPSSTISTGHVRQSGENWGLNGTELKVEFLAFINWQIYCHFQDILWLSLCAWICTYHY